MAAHTRNRYSLWLGVAIALCLWWNLPTSEALFYPNGTIDYSKYVNGSWLFSPRLLGYGKDNFGQLIVETRMWYEDYTGHALILDAAVHGYSPEETCRRALANGTLHGYGLPAVIMQPSPAIVAGYGQFARDFSDMTWVGVPTVEISLIFFYLAQGVSNEGYVVPLIVGVRDDDVSPAEGAWPGSVVILVSIILSSLCIACYCINFFKFYHHLRFTRGVTTAKVFFAIDILGNFMRLWYVCINPFYVSLLNYTWTTMCNTTHVALSCICCLLLALKWRELLLRSKLQVTVFLTTFKYPFFAVATFMFLFEFIASAFRGHWYSLTPINEASWSMLVIMAVTVSVLLLVSGGQILMHLKNAVGSKRRIFQLSWTTFMIMGSGIFLLIWAILLLILLIGLYAEHKGSVVWLNTNSSLSFACLLFASLLQNLAMPIPRPGYDTTASTTHASRANGSKRQSTMSSAKITASVTTTTTTTTDDQEEEEGDQDDVELVPTTDDPEACLSKPLKPSGKENTSESNTPEEESDESSESDEESSDEES